MNNKKLTLTALFHTGGPALRSSTTGQLASHLLPLVGALFLALAPWHSRAAEPTEPLQFITIDVAPWAANNSDTGEPEGAFVAIVNELAERTGRDIHITLTPFARVDRELEAGSQDCTILIPRDEEIVTIGELVSYHPMGVVAHQDVALESYRDLYPLKISLLRGSAITPQFDEDPKLQKEYDTDYAIALRKISRGRVDAVAGAIPTILYLAEHQGLSEYLGEPLVLDQVPLMFQCSNRSANLPTMAEFNAAIQAMHQDGTMEAIQRKYNF